MNFAYDWAFAKPIRKVFYNLTITGLSVFVAFFIGTIEILGLDRARGEPERPLLQVRPGLQHQHGGIRHRRGVRRDLGRCPPLLALGQCRGEVGRQDAAPPVRGEGHN
jgi:hypothetical protein